MVGAYGEKARIAKPPAASMFYRFPSIADIFPALMNFEPRKLPTAC